MSIIPGNTIAIREREIRHHSRQNKKKTRNVTYININQRQVSLITFFFYYYYYIKKEESWYIK